MASIRTGRSRPLGAVLAPTRVTLLAVATVYAVTAVFDLATQPSTQHQLHSWAEYGFTALLVPFALAMLVAVAHLHALHGGAADPLGRTGVRVAAVGVALFVLDAAITLAAANTDTAGPLYPIAMLLTLVGIVIFAVASHRTAVLPPWCMPAVTIAWIIGGPTGEGVIVRGAALLLTGVFIAIAVALAPLDERTVIEARTV